MAQDRKDRAICFMQLEQPSREDRALDLAKANRNMKASSATHTVAIRTSVTVKARGVVASNDCRGMLMRPQVLLGLTLRGKTQAFVEMEPRREQRVRFGKS